MDSGIGSYMILFCRHSLIIFLNHRLAYPLRGMYDFIIQPLFFTIPKLPKIETVATRDFFWISYFPVATFSPQAMPPGRQGYGLKKS